MKATDLQVGELYYSKEHELVMEYCGVEKFQGHTYHNFYDASWKLFHWIEPKDVEPVKGQDDGHK